MVPLTGCSQEPCHTNVSEGSVKFEDDSGETPHEISHHSKQDSSTDCPPLTAVLSRRASSGSRGENGAENQAAWRLFLAPPQMRRVTALSTVL